MCQYQTWFYKKEIGYVKQCLACKKILVWFNIIAVTFTPNEFENFRQHIDRIYTTHQYIKDKTVKSVLIPSPCEGLSLLLNIHELCQLHCMLEDADNEMKASSLLKDFEDF